MTGIRARSRWADGVRISLVIAVLTACGGSAPGGRTSAATPTTTAPTPPAASPGSPSYAPATATPQAPGTPLTVWVVTTTAGEVVRVAPTATLAFRTVATLPMGTTSLGAGGHHLLALFPDNHLHGLDLLTGALTDYGGGAGYSFYGAAVAPDGQHVAYVRAVAASFSATLRVLDLTTRTVTALHSFSSSTYDVPMVWNTSSIGAVQIVGFADAGPQGVSRLSPADGTRTAHTDSPDARAQVAQDAIHAADSTHTALGDDADAPAGPGPQGPFNTLRSITIGSAPIALLAEAHHTITPLGVSAEGSTIAYFDDSAAGGFAGISQSPDFGLFTWSGGRRTQLDHYGSRWDAAAFTDAGTLVAARHSGSSETLVRVTGTTLTEIDIVAGNHATVYSLGG